MNIGELTRKHNFHFSKKFGQNFIGDENLLNAIVVDAGITKDDTVLEIGTGAGSLTLALARTAKKVYTFEIDKDLQPIHEDVFANVDNIEVIYDDILKWNINKVNELVNGDYKIVANLPYYITTPIIFNFIENETPLKSMTIMVQKEVAQRICAKENTADYGALTISVGVKSNPKITRIVSRTNFTPQPNVDSAIVRMDIIKREGIISYSKLSSLIKSAFAMRRKTLVNNLVNSFSMSKQDAITLLEKNNIPSTARGESLSIEQFISLANSMVK